MGVAEHVRFIYFLGGTASLFFSHDPESFLLPPLQYKSKILGTDKFFFFGRAQDYDLHHHDSPSRGRLLLPEEHCGAAPCRVAVVE